MSQKKYFLQSASVDDTKTALTLLPTLYGQYVKMTDLCTLIDLTLDKATNKEQIRAFSKGIASELNVLFPHGVVYVEDLVCGDMTVVELVRSAKIGLTGTSAVALVSPMIMNTIEAANVLASSTTPIVVGPVTSADQVNALFDATHHVLSQVITCVVPMTTRVPLTGVDPNTLVEILTTLASVGRMECLVMVSNEQDFLTVNQLEAVTGIVAPLSVYEACAVGLEVLPSETSQPIVTNRPAILSTPSESRSYRISNPITDAILQSIELAWKDRIR